MELGEFLYNLVHSEKPSEYILQWGMYNQITKDYKLIAACEEYDKDVVYPKGLVNILNQKDTDFVPYFMTEKIFFLDTTIIQSMVQNSSVPIQYDYSIMLDTNYTSYIETFLKDFNKPNFSEGSIYKTLDTLLRNQFNYDYTYYLIENYKNLFSSGEKTFTISDSNHIALYENLYYLELFKSINHKEYINSNKIEFMISENEAKQKTDELISIIYNNTKDGLRIFIDMHQNITLLLIGIWQVQFSSKASAKNKMKKLFDFVRTKVGVYYERELIIALKYFEDAKSVGMLNKINKGGNQKRLLEKIENIAWDFLVPRVMEFQININKEKSYFVPFFLSHDKKLKDLVRMFRIKGILLHKETKEFIPISELNTNKFFEEKGLLKSLEVLKSDKVMEERFRVMTKNLNNNFEIIDSELKKLTQILDNRG
ncbi:hypothetical protein V4483_22570 [Bacillus paranthracis]|uniref:hypothetical protein n=1 Tax=Bacillus cereus group TaxID=86661 RepID=UPI0022E72A33|nr:hypothetical protein [Bacillus cereus group sp. Bc015]MBL3847007.1 hypothetical protein [Bacillus cereus]MDA2736335.1 hypothetical protein [Bacillus cereus group sp. Bc015]